MSDQETVVVQRARNPLYIVLGVVVGVFLLFLLWVFVIQPLLTGDDTEDTDVVAAQPTATPTATGTDQPELPQATPSPEITEGEQPPIETYEIFLSRDPFQPVRPAVAPDGAPGEPPPADGQPPTDGQTPADGQTPTDGVTPTDGELPPTGEEDRATVDGREVTLIDVFEEDGERRAVVQVDGTAYEVGVGDRFADNFEVLSIDPPCATLLFGDDAFTVCEGERVLK